SAPIPRDLVDELNTTASWLERRGGDLRVEYVEGTWVSPLPALPDFSSARSARFDHERARVDQRSVGISRRRAG
ncbi:MAG: hypothetical protein ACKOYM_08100, partial [Actinomycetes bacterium]